MDVSFPYQKKRSEFGRQCLFSDRGPELIDNFPSFRKLYKEFMLKDPVTRYQQCAPVQAEHYLNTMRAEFANVSINHVEGGWPKDVNIADEEQTKRQPNQVGYSLLQSDIQNHVPKQAKVSYIWEVENPNRPLHILKPDDYTVCLEYNQKDPHILASGQFGGQVAVWDVRKGMEPVEVSVKENSFIDPVQKLLWIHSKTGTEFFSASSDGEIKWWDTRKLSEPTDTLILDYAKEEEQQFSKALGVSVLEYEVTIPTRFMVGTEQVPLYLEIEREKQQ
ncbi:unnamed protein product [Diabrotica balteata]|uniref:Dynein intermediate chain 3, ciliary n=1 Tax=Diabrotica balteata TaxID=107213 RepID=A0A9N9TBT4_DIABA|nr:unnamed protein product [Diabrotica balteata]